MAAAASRHQYECEVVRRAIARRPVVDDSEVMHRFAGPNEPHTALSCVRFFCLGMALLSRSAQRRHIHQALTAGSSRETPALAERMRREVADVLSRMKMVEREYTKHIALFDAPEDRRQGLPVWGDPSVSELAPAIRMLQTSLAQAYTTLQMLATNALPEAEIIDGATREMVAGRAVPQIGDPPFIRRIS